MQYLQRQISSFIGNDSSPDPVTYGIGDRVWTLQDVYPSKIQVLGDGDVLASEISIATMTTVGLSLPHGYVNGGTYATNGTLSFFLRTTQTIKIVTDLLLPTGETTNTVLVRAGIASDSNGFYSFTGRIKSITVTNPQAVAATIEYFSWQYPVDITVAEAWRDGAQTIGTAPTA